MSKLDLVKTFCKVDFRFEYFVLLRSLLSSRFQQWFRELGLQRRTRQVPGRAGHSREPLKPDPGWTHFLGGL